MACSERVRDPSATAVATGRPRPQRRTFAAGWENETWMAELYSQLGVARGADEADIKKAYRKLAKELHPDRNRDNPKASERFSKVTSAYDILSDKDKRAQYDRGE